MIGCTILKLKSGFIVEEGANEPMGLESRKHAFTTLQETLEFAKALLSEDDEAHK